MSNQEKYYVTQSNLKKMVYRSGIVERDLSEIYETFKQFSLSDFISEKEARNLGSLTVFLKRSEGYLVNLLEQNKAKIIKSNEANLMIFVSGAPKYHKDSTCKTLSQDFENFEIPAEIKNRGAPAVKAFREFASANRKLLNEGREDVFILRLKQQFQLVADIGKVSFSNSGKASLPVASADGNLSQLAAQIVTAAARIESLRETNGGAAALEKFRFAPLSRLTQGAQLNHAERQVLERKRDLIAFVTEYIVRKNNNNGSVFSQKLLEVYGFEPCGVCCGAGIKLHLD